MDGQKCFYLIEFSNTYQTNADGQYVLNIEEINNIIEKMIAKKEIIDTNTHFITYNNKTIVVTDYGKIIDLDKLSINSQRGIIKKFIKRVFNDFKICTIDSIEVKTSATGLNKLANAVKSEHFGILLLSDKLVQTAQYDHSSPDSSGRKMEYRYYKAYISLNKKSIFSMQLNIRTDHTGSILYDINKINQVGLSDSASRGLSDSINNLTK